MAKQMKLTKADLERGEEIDVFTRAYFWVASHSTLILGIVAVVLLAYTAVHFMRIKEHRESVAASDKLFNAFQAYERALSKPWGSEDRAKEMEAARAKADEVLNEWKGERVSRNALFLKGNTYFFQGDRLNSANNTNTAIDLFRQYRDQAVRDGDVFEQAAAALALGYAYENLYILSADNMDQAKAAFEAALETYNTIIEQEQGTGFLRHEALNAKARLLEFQGQIDEAKQLYFQVLEERFEPVTLPQDPQEATPSLLLRHFLNEGRQFTAAGTARVRLIALGETPESINARLAGKGAQETAAKP